MDKKYSFRWYGEYEPVSRSYEETKTILTPLINDELITESVTKRIDAIGNGGKILDFGCSFGTFSRLAARKGNEVLGIDLNEDSINIAKDFFHHPNVEYRCTNLFETGLPDGCFDGILFFHTIEHLTSFDPFITEFNRLLKPGGYILCATPNAMALNDVMLEWFSFRDKDGKYLIRTVKGQPALPDLDHICAFTRQTLVKLFNRTGFDVQSCELIGHPSTRVPRLGLPIPAWIRRSFLLHSFGDELLLKATKRGS